MQTPKTDAEVMEALRNDTPLNRARRVFSSFCARIEQAGAQRKPLDPIEWRRMEFEAVAQIAAALEAPHLSPPGAPEALPAPATKVRTCNMHEDCDAADAKRQARDGKRAAHCHSDDCEDCFGT